MNQVVGSIDLRNLQHQESTDYWRLFFVWVTGTTNGAHDEIVKKLKHHGQTEVDSPEKCDYILVFCPISSRVGTDIKEAMNKVHPDKPIILVVMHHTFNPDHVVAESSRLVSNLNVLLTVDCFFYEDKFLKCNRNDIAWYEIKRFLRLPQDSLPKKQNLICTWLSNRIIVVSVFVILVLIIVAVILGMWYNRKI